MWHDLLTAVALMMVIEGILPFLSPHGFKNMLRSLSELEDRPLRWSGLFSMIAGVVLLYLVR